MPLALDLMVSALRDVQWEWLLRGSEVPFLGRFPIDLYMAVLIVVAIAVYIAALAVGAIILLASAVLTIGLGVAVAFYAAWYHVPAGVVGGLGLVALCWANGIGRKLT